jgi:DNA-binding transcriptional regulator GbsR (MarR family)
VNAELNKDQKAYIERFGQMLKSMGASAAMGKIIGYLIISEPPHCSFEQIQTDLKLSKGAVSNTLKIMEVQGLIEAFTVAGERKRYFRLALRNRAFLIIKHISETDRFISIMEESLLLRNKGNEEFEKVLVEYIDLYKLLQMKMLEVIKEMK